MYCMVVPLGARYEGLTISVASLTLLGFALGRIIDIDIHPGSLKMPKDPTVPIICIAPGTGVAPMRAVIEDRVVDESNGPYSHVSSSIKS